MQRSPLKEEGTGHHSAHSRCHCPLLSALQIKEKENNLLVCGTDRGDGVGSSWVVYDPARTPIPHRCVCSLRKGNWYEQSSMA